MGELVAKEEFIGEFSAVALVGLCRGCDRRELDIEKVKACGGCYVEAVVCKHREECRARAMYELGEGGLK